MVKLSIYYIIPAVKEIEVEDSVIEDYNRTKDIHGLLWECEIFGAERACVETEDGEMIADWWG